MRLIDFTPHGESYSRLGALVRGTLHGDRILEIGESAKGTLTRFIERGMPGMDDLAEAVTKVEADSDSVKLKGHVRRQFAPDQVTIHPLQPRSLRDFYAFEQHVKTAHESRGRTVPEAWYQIPVFYFSNVSAIYGDGDTIPYPSYSEALDYELEIAAVIGKAGMNIQPVDAIHHIAGYTIFNDWSARDEQRREMAVGLGPAKGKDFASSLGPVLLTPDELADHVTDRFGVFDLDMIARVNGVERSRGNMRDLFYSFGQMIERASRDVCLQPGDVIGSGTVGTGCLLELTAGQGAWLKPGDVVELEIERIGTLRNTIGEKRE